MKGVMRENVDQALANVEKIEEIDQKSQDLEASSRKFHDDSKKIKCRMIKQKWKLIGLIAIIIIVVVIIIVVAATQIK